MEATKKVESLTKEQAQQLTREEAIALLVEIDVERWGESEREASRQMNRGRTIGLALNALWAHVELHGTPNPALLAVAKSKLTKADWSQLRQGG